VTRLARYIFLSVFLILPATLAHGDSGEDASDALGAVSLWDLSGVTGGSEGYENQLALGLSPGLPLGRWLQLPGVLQPLRVDLELLVQVELAGNDAAFRGAQFPSAALFERAGPEQLAVSETGQVLDALSGRVEGTGKRVLLSDLWLELGHPELYRAPDPIGIQLGAGLAFTFPTSSPSLNTGFLLGVSGGLSLSRTLFGRLELSYGFRHAQYFYSNVTEDVAAMGGEVEINGRSEPLFQPQRSTLLNPSYAFINTFSARLGLPVRGLSLSASYALTNSFSYELPRLDQYDTCADGQAVADAVGGQVIGCGDRAQRDSQMLRVQLAYRVLPQLSVGLALATIQPIRHEGAQLSNPFVQTLPRTNYTTVQLGVDAHLEPLIRSAAGLFSKKGR
jgi:hypothetical protein